MLVATERQRRVKHVVAIDPNRRPSFRKTNNNEIRSASDIPCCWESSKPPRLLNTRSTFPSLLSVALVITGELLLICSVCEARAAGINPSTANAGLAEHLARLATQAPKNFTLVPQSPFVVLGDEAPEVVRRRATQTVKWAVEKLKQDYFQRDPQEIIDIWLFRDHASYTNHAQLLFHDTPSSRFGYYSEAHHALIMDISTGGGTLVHEIVHPFMHANFPNCPPWFNEGLASLYEASVEKNGHIQGRVNWRFKGLEQAIKEGRTVSFQKLTSMSAAEFYGGDGYSQHYAQARYLCYYLQERGLLVKFYRQFVAAARNDPTGYNTLKRALGESDMEAFKKKWESFVLGLRT